MWLLFLSLNKLENKKENILNHIGDQGNQKICFTVNKLSKLLHIGTCKLFRTCKKKQCGEFLNREYSTNCAIHQKEGLEFSRQLVQARRANFRSNNVFDPESKESQEINRKKISKLGFAKTADFEVATIRKPAPFREFTVRELPKQTKENEKKVVLKLNEEEKELRKRELKRKIKDQKRLAEQKLKSMLNSRKSKFISGSNMKKIKSHEEKFMSNLVKKDNSENVKPNFVKLEETEDVNISSYAYLLQKKKDNATVEKKESKINPILTKGMKFSDFIKVKNNS